MPLRAAPASGGTKSRPVQNGKTHRISRAAAAALKGEAGDGKPPSHPQRSSPAQSHPLRSICPSRPPPQDAAELRTGMGRTGMVHSEMGCTGIGHTGTGCTEMVCSEMGCTGMGHTGIGCTGIGCTGMGCTRMGHTGTGRTGMGRTGMGRTGIGSVSCHLATPLLGTAGNVPTKSPGGAWRAAAALPRAGHPSLPAASTTPRSARGAPRTSNTSRPGPAPSRQQRPPAGGFPLCSSLRGR